MPESLCGSIVQSRRGLLAFIWSIVTIATIISFITAIVYAYSSIGNQYDDDYNYNEEKNEGDRRDEEPVVAVTSRAEAFAALWTAILASGMSIYGTVVLGVQSPTGQYYSCCAGAVHRTSPLSLGVFIGALLMFANVTLICSVLFGEFNIRDYQYGEDKERNRNQNQYQDVALERTAFAFSLMCLFLTFLYALFAALVYIFYDAIIAENLADARQEALQPSPDIGVNLHPGGGYVGGPFESSKKQPGFITPQSENTRVIA